MYSNAGKTPVTISAGTGTDARGAGGRVHRHRSLRKSLAMGCLGIAAVLAATGVVTGVVPHTPSRAADAATTTCNWVVAPGTVYALKSADPATGNHFLNTPNAYVAGGNPAASPVPPGYASTPVMNYTSYAEFASDVNSRAISYPFRWVQYDPENWSATPLAERQDPGKYMRLFASLAHSRGMKVIMAPALNLGGVSGSVLPRRAGESPAQWYVRVNIAGKAATGDLVVVQNESQTTNLTQYKFLYNSAHSQAAAVNPSAIVDAEVSAENGTPSQMVTAARSVTADGYYVAAAGNTNATSQFFNMMEAAGY